MSESPEPASIVRMPNGVMDYLENGAGVVEVAEAEARSAVGDPRSYERARARLEDPDRKSSVRHTGTPTLTRLFELLAPGKRKAAAVSDGYIARFDRIGRHHDVPALSVNGDADDIAGQVYRYARARLGSRDVSVTIDLEKRTGAIIAGVRSAGSVTLEPTS